MGFECYLKVLASNIKLFLTTDYHKEYAYISMIREEKSEFMIPSTKTDCKWEATRKFSLYKNTYAGSVSSKALICFNFTI